jgi:hypothetical protein
MICKLNKSEPILRSLQKRRAVINPVAYERAISVFMTDWIKLDNKK